MSNLVRSEVCEQGFRFRYDLNVVVELGQDNDASGVPISTDTKIKSKNGVVYLIHEELKEGLTDYIELTVNGETKKYTSEDFGGDKSVFNQVEMLVADLIRKEQQ
jgi:hypothetical protein